MSAAQPSLPGAGITVRILREDGKTYAGVTVPPELYSAGATNTKLAAATGLSIAEQARARNAIAMMPRHPREPDYEGIGWAIYTFPGSSQFYFLRDDGTHLSWGAPQSIFTPAMAVSVLRVTVGLSAAELQRLVALVSPQTPAFNDDANAETANLIAHWTLVRGITAPTQARRYMIDHLFSRLKAAGGLNGIVAVPLAHAEGADLTNWASPGFLDVERVGGVVFSPNVGGVLNGTSAYYRALVPPSGVPNYSQNDAALSVDIVGSTSTGLEVGAETGTRIAAITPRTAGNNQAGRVNSTTTVTIGANANHDGLAHLQRVDASTLSGYMNANLIGTVASVSAAPTDQPGPSTFGRDASNYANGTLRFLRIGSSVAHATMQAGWAEYTTAAAASDARSPGYLYTLMNLASGLYPATLSFGGRTVYVSGGGVSYPGLNYALRQSSSGGYIRGELRNTIFDRRPADLPNTRRRNELGDNDNKMARGQVYWMAASVRFLPFAKPASMLQTALLSGTILQIKGDDDGSASIGWRRTNDDNFAISTVGGTDPSQGTIRYNQPIAKNVWHDLVMRMVLHETAGELDLWLDQVPILNLTGIPTAPTPFGDGSFAKILPYFSGGLGSDPLSTVIVDYANMVWPQTTSLVSRTTVPPAFPAD